MLVSVLNDGDKVGKPCWASQTLAIHHLRSIKIIWVCLTVEVQKTDHVPPQMRQPRAQAHGSQPSRAGFCRPAHPSIHKAGLQWLLIQILGVSAFEHQGPAVLWIIRKPDSLHGGSRDLVGELRWWLDGAPPKGLCFMTTQVCLQHAINSRILVIWEGLFGFRDFRKYKGLFSLWAGSCSPKNFYLVSKYL